MRALVSLLLILMVFLTGCVRYDVGIDFQNQHRGEIIQNINLAPQLSRLSQKEVQEWIDSLQKRAENLNGKLENISENSFRVIIPFSNGQELSNKFNQLYHQQTRRENKQSDKIDLVNLDAQMSIEQTNLLLLERNLMNFTVDLRGLGVVSQEGNIIVSSGSLLDLNLGITSPLMVQLIQQNAQISKKNNELIWHLQPGQINQLEVICWVPSYLGIGGALIILLFFAGYYLKYKRIPGTALNS
ncbi:MAG: DUF3153 domain-containing protein [Cyanobacteriota bacterium ELA615]